MCVADQPEATAAAAVGAKCYMKRWSETSVSPFLSLSLFSYTHICFHYYYYIDVAEKHIRFCAGKYNNITYYIYINGIFQLGIKLSHLMAVLPSALTRWQATHICMATHVHVPTLQHKWNKQMALANMNNIIYMLLYTIQIKDGGRTASPRSPSTNTHRHTHLNMLEGIIIIY